MSLLGFSDEQKQSLKAAYLGEELFISYHYLLNNTYGRSVLGIKSQTAPATSGNNASSIQAALNSTDPQTYSVFYYSSQDLFTESFYWNFYHRLAPQ